jgi:hypothetical protein
MPPSRRITAAIYNASDGIRDSLPDPRWGYAATAAGERPSAMLASGPLRIHRRARRSGLIGRFGGLAPVIVGWIALAAASSTAAAQIPSLVDLSAEYAPSAKMDNPHASEAQLSSYQLALNAPIPLSARRFLIVGASYRVDAIAFSRMEEGISRDLSFQAPGLSVALIQLLPKRWSLSLRVAGSLAGDFAAVDRGMLQGSAVALAIHRMSDRLVLGGGALVSAGFGKILPLPAVLLNWKPIDGLRIDAFVPAFVDARYTAWNRVELGARMEVGGAKYAIRDAEVAARWPCAPQPTDDPTTPADDTRARPEACFDHLSSTVVNVGLLAGVRLAPSVWLTAFGGVTVYRQFEEQNRNGDTIADGVHAFPTAAFLRASATWRIPRS